MNPKTVKIPEKQRTYFYPKEDGGFYEVTVENVVEVMVSESGNHRLKTADKKLNIVPAGWLRIEIDAEDWTF